MFTLVELSIPDFWDVMLCCWVSGFWQFEGLCCICVQGQVDQEDFGSALSTWPSKWRQYIPQKCWEQFTQRWSMLSHKSRMFKFTCYITQNKERTLSLMKQPCVVTHTINQTEFSAWLNSWVTNTPSIKCVCKRKLLLFIQRVSKWLE